MGSQVACPGLGVDLVLQGGRLSPVMFVTPGGPELLLEMSTENCAQNIWVRCPYPPEENLCLAWQVTLFRRKAKSYPSFSCLVGMFKVHAF